MPLGNAAWECRKAAFWLMAVPGKQVLRTRQWWLMQRARVAGRGVACRDVVARVWSADICNGHHCKSPIEVENVQFDK